MEELKRYLNGLGACDLKDNVDSLESAIRMMFTPQGREFCVKTGFPTLEFLRKHKEELNAIPGVFIDDGRITPSFIPDNVTNILISGDTKAYLCVSKPKLCLSAEVFAVATITEIGEVHTEIANDGTAKVIIER